jgi:hypothetical protein
MSCIALQVKQVKFLQPEVEESGGENVKPFGPKKKPRQRITGLLKQLRAQVHDTADNSPLLSSSSNTLSSSSSSLISSSSSPSSSLP